MPPCLNVWSLIRLALTVLAMDARMSVKMTGISTSVRKVEIVRRRSRWFFHSSTCGGASGGDFLGRLECAVGICEALGGVDLGRSCSGLVRRITGR